MQSATFTSPRTLTDLVKYELDQSYCRNGGVFTAGGTDVELVIGTPIAVVGVVPVLFDAGASDGSEVLAGLCLTSATVATTTSVEIAYIEIGPAIVSKSEIAWPTGTTAPQITAGEAALVAKNFKLVTPVGSTN